jgi:L-asparaginase
MQSTDPRVVILGTGGTIAGTAARPDDAIGYTAARLGVGQLVAAVPALAGTALESEQVAQLDSKDIDFATWQQLARRAAHHLARVDVAGVVVTHGTDTLEETAWFLHRVLAPAKPLVLTAAMRPATAQMADGPQNLVDAVTLARAPDVRGVLVAVAGSVHGAADVRKAHTYRLDAFESGDAGAVACIEEGRVRRLREWPQAEPLGLERIAPDAAGWPWVEIVSSHAGARAATVDALVAAGVRGLVVAGTGNGTVHRELQPALERARAAGVVVVRSTRCAGGPVFPRSDDAWPAYGALGPAKTRVELLLELLTAG